MVVSLPLAASLVVVDTFFLSSSVADLRSVVMSMEMPSLPGVPSAPFSPFGPVRPI